FQAEDGIRDPLVTGVQTCALPIWPRRMPSGNRARPLRDHREVASRAHAFKGGTVLPILKGAVRSTARDSWRSLPSALLDSEEDRSEERRVGKEARTRW